MKLSELVIKLSDKTKHDPKILNRAIKETFGKIMEHVQSGGRCEFREFGVFYKTSYFRKTINPKTLESYPERLFQNPKFRASKFMEMRINNRDKEDKFLSELANKLDVSDTKTVGHGEAWNE